MLRLENLEVAYGKRTVLRGLSLAVGGGEVVALIGANAAGKTTTLRAAAGLTPHRAGEVWMGDARMDGLATPRRVRHGLVLVPEGRNIFAGMTVRENLLMGAYSREDAQEVPADMQRIFDLFPRLSERRAQRAGTMSGGEQQMLAIGRGLMADPRVLLLDEPTLGLAPIMISEIGRAVAQLAAQGLSILIAEQNASFALGCSHTAHVLEDGHIRLGGPSRTLAREPRVATAYLGI